MSLLNAICQLWRTAPRWRAYQLHIDVSQQMGFRDFLDRLFRPGKQAPVERVRFYDVDSQRVILIPAAELVPGVVQAHVQGIDGIVWLDPSKLQQGDVKHPPLDEEVREYIRQIQQAFAEHRELTLQEWEEGFRRDGNPAKEIALWSHAADVYQQFAADETSGQRRKEIYRCVISCLTTGPDDVWQVLQPENLTREETAAVVNRYFPKQVDD